MKSKNIVKFVKGEYLYTPSTYARKYGRDAQEVYNMMRDERLKVVTYRGRRYVTGFPPAGWKEVDGWQDFPEKKPEPVTVPDLPDSPIVPTETSEPSEQPAPKRARSPRSFDLNFEKARKTAASLTRKAALSGDVSYSWEVPVLKRPTKHSSTS
jgi:hypothetical protein